MKAKRGRGTRFQKNPVQALAIGQLGANGGMAHHAAIRHGGLIPGGSVTGLALPADLTVREHSTQRLALGIGIERARAEQHAAALEVSKNDRQQSQRRSDNTGKCETA